MYQKTTIILESDEDNGLTFSLYNDPALPEGTIYDNAPRAAQVGHMVDILTDVVQAEGPDTVLAALAKLKADSEKKQQELVREAEASTKH